MKLTKEDIGKTFWAIPMGNNVRREGKSRGEPRELVITQMRRIKGKFKFADAHFETDFSIGDWESKGFIYVNTGYNGGYKLWKSKEDLELWQKANKFSRGILDLFTYSWSNKLEPQAVIEAAKILGVKEDV